MSKRVVIVVSLIFCYAELDDGSMNVVKKEAALDKIRKDPSYTIVLIR